MAGGDQLIRQWTLLHVLVVRGGQTIPELMREVKCSRRTIWRDLAALRQAGFSLTTEQDGRENRYRLIEGPQGTPSIPFTRTELMSLHLGRHLLVPLRGTPLGEAVRTALDKVSATLTPAAKAFLDRLDRGVSARTSHGKDHSRATDTLRLLQEALHERRTVEAEYHSFGRDAVSRRRLDPLHIWWQQGGIYLAAYCHTRRQVITFALERFAQVRLTDDTFDYPSDFDLDRYLEGSFGLFRGDAVRVTLRFSRQVARDIAERQWHPSQTLAPLLTGELEMTLRVALRPEFRRWILGYGKDVEVLEPKSLRDDIRREWLAALRGATGRLEPLRLAAGRRRSRRQPQPGTTRADRQGTGPRLRQAGPATQRRR